MTFKEASDELMARVTIEEIATACEVSRNTIERARMEGEHSRREPAGWRGGLAKLARKRGGELQRLADELERSEAR